MIALLFVWLHRITQSALWSYTLSLIAAFCTLLWPYAYIGIEPKQSLCVLAAGYLALETAGRATLARSLLLGLACGGAISLKASGTYSFPLWRFLIGVYSIRPAARSIRTGRHTCCRS
jgi:predicted membrane-bound dolichyl-phosphate-mannose-protein mannosyltransferase